MVMKGQNSDDLERPYLEDPELGDENDPEYRQEMLETFKSLGLTPADIKTDDKLRADYAAWLKTQ
jgi:hypothetical protein